jgi:hypothetical protein
VTVGIIGDIGDRFLQLIGGYLKYELTVKRLDTSLSFLNVDGGN